MTSPNEVFTNMEQIRSKTLAYLDRFDQEQLDWRPNLESSAEEN